ncbi:MAG: reverse transcriptase-like protein [Elusimicrobiota bacterium]|jgi:ribonuclease HI|nr:reverse transcriptase-like protein [Elusimicrobiota bacterium]
MTLYSTELKQKAEEFISILGSLGVKAEFGENSFRDYFVIVKACYNAEGFIKANLNLYFKPSKNSFSLYKKIKDERFDKIVEIAWDKLNNFHIYDAQSGIYEAFVDGSYIEPYAGYGAAIYLENDIKARISGIIKDASSRQIAGEFQAVIETLKWCGENQVKKIRINYDYSGIEKFASGAWKAQNPVVKNYVKQILNSDIEIEWRYVKSHSGNIKNNVADVLAKKAVEEIKK